MSDAAGVAGREVVNTRVFAASRERVFEAWTDPAQLARWWGPKGFRNTFHEFEFRPGGVIRFTMHSPEGHDFENKCVYEEISRPERIVLRHLETIHVFTVTATFAEKDGGTLLTFRQLFDSAEECGRIRKFVTEKNEENLDRLEALLAETAGER